MTLEAIRDVTDAASELKGIRRQLTTTRTALYIYALLFGIATNSPEGELDSRALAGNVVWINQREERLIEKVAEIKAQAGLNLVDPAVELSVLKRGRELGRVLGPSEEYGEGFMQFLIDRSVARQEQLLGRSRVE